MEGADDGGGHGPGGASEPEGVAVRVRGARRGAERAAQHAARVPVPAAPVVVRPRQPVPQDFPRGPTARVSPWKKLHLLYDFFFLRKLVAHLLTFSFYCVVIPACVLAGSDHVRLPKYVALYVPAAITLLNAACTPRSCHLLIFWILFENVMSMHRTKATLIGLLEATRANEWVVTDKRGNANPKHQQPANTTTRPGRKTTTSSSRTSFFNNDVHVAEILLGACLLYCALYDIAYGRDSFYIYLLLQSAAAFIVGFGYVGT